MKLSGRDAAGYFARPDKGIAAALLYGADPVRTALRRKTLLETLTGAGASEEMRLTRMSAADLRRDPASLMDAIKAVGFFPGDRAVFLEEAGDGITAILKNALADWKSGDARIVVTAGGLGPRSSLRKFFETAKNAVSIGIYSDPPKSGDVIATLEKAGVGKVTRDAVTDLESLARVLEPGDFEQFLIKLAIYHGSDDGELTSREVLDCAPAAPGAEMDVLIDLVADGKADAIAREFARLGSQGGNPTSLTIAAARYFRTLYVAATDTEGPDRALARARPPVFGPRRTRMATQARNLGTTRIEAALTLIMDADLRLRSGRPTPGLALVERLFIRIAKLR